MGFLAIAIYANGVVGLTSRATYGSITLSLSETSMNLQWKVTSKRDYCSTFDFFNLQRSQALLVLLRTTSPELDGVPSVDDMWRGFMIQAMQNDRT
jgi:hypothetical protein